MTQMVKESACYAEDLGSVLGWRDLLQKGMVFDCMDHNKLWKINKEMRIPDHLTCLLRNQYTSHEAIVRSGWGRIDWFKIGKGV